jgi:hypothetical protein
MGDGAGTVFGVGAATTGEFVGAGELVAQCSGVLSLRTRTKKTMKH